MFTQHAPRPLAASGLTAAAAAGLGSGPPRLSLYAQPPDGEASVDELEAFALDRLQVLRAVEDAHLRGRGDDDVRRRIDAALARHLPSHSGRGGGAAARQAAAERRKDAVSHFVLRLAFSRSDDLRTWFVRQETALLRHRFRAADAADRAALLAAAHVPATPLPPAERDARLGPAAAAFYGAAEPVYAVAFERVPALVARAQAVVRGGVAYVAAADVAALAEAAFRDALAAALALCARALPQLGEDERLLPVLRSLGRQSARAEYQPTGAAGALTADAVAPLAAAAFPPCMRHLQAQLAHDRHLRHAGRLQLGLFLKAAGLPLADAMVFWRRAFAGLTDDQFQKAYAYNVRHSYGQEGRRANYTAYSCHRIITAAPPGPGDHHGCPFRHHAPDRLRAALHADRLADADVRDIADLARAGHCQVACTRHLEARLAQRRQQPQQPASATLPQPQPQPDPAPVPPVTSPNQYLDLLLTDGRGARASPADAVLAGAP